MTHVLRCLPGYTWCVSGMHYTSWDVKYDMTPIIAPEAPHMYRADPHQVLCLECFELGHAERNHDGKVTVLKGYVAKVTVLPDGEYVRTLGPGSLVPSDQMKY